MNHCPNPALDKGYPGFQSIESNHRSIQVAVRHSPQPAIVSSLSKEKNRPKSPCRLWVYEDSKGYGAWYTATFFHLSTFNSRKLLVLKIHAFLSMSQPIVRLPMTFGWYHATKSSGFIRPMSRGYSCTYCTPSPVLSRIQSCLAESQFRCATICHVR